MKKHIPINEYSIGETVIRIFDEYIIVDDNEVNFLKEKLGKIL